MRRPAPYAGKYPLPQNLTTYQVTSPRATHTRPGTCEEAGCGNLAFGWVTVVDESTDLGQRQAAYIRKECRPESAPLSPAMLGVRRYTEYRHEMPVEVSRRLPGHAEDSEPWALGPGLVAFVFPPGQTCFTQHRVDLLRPENFMKRRGTSAYRVDEPHRFDRGDQWVDDFGTHLDRLATLRERG